jgi:hypothetical protein
VKEGPRNKDQWEKRLKEVCIPISLFEDSTLTSFLSLSAGVAVLALELVAVPKLMFERNCLSGKGNALKISQALHK